MPKKTKPIKDPVAPRLSLDKLRMRHEVLLADHLLLPGQEEVDKMIAEPEKYEAELKEIAERINQFSEAHPAPSEKPKKVDAEQTKHFKNQREIMEKISEALQKPITPDPETAAKHRLAPSERPSPYRYGTLEWYRNELALAQNRIQLLEDERDWLMTEFRRQRKVINRLLDENEKRAKYGFAKKDGTVPDNWRKVWDMYRKEHPDWKIKTLNYEVATELKCPVGALRMVRQRANRKKSTHRA